jgi:hypothetical protein
VNGKSVELLDNLRGELSRWRENERARLAAWSREKPVQNRE